MFYCKRCPHKTFKTRKSLDDHKRSPNVTAHNHPEWFKKNINEIIEHDKRREKYKQDVKNGRCYECSTNEFNDYILGSFTGNVVTPTMCITCNPKGSLQEDEFVEHWFNEDEFIKHCFHEDEIVENRKQWYWFWPPSWFNC